jgi:hypothetical protein
VKTVQQVEDWRTIDVDQRHAAYAITMAALVFPKQKRHSEKGVKEQFAAQRQEGDALQPEFYDILEISKENMPNDTFLLGDMLAVRRHF